MSSNFREFDRALREHAERTPERVAARHRSLALETLADAVETSPVDEGDYRASWNASVGAPDPARRRGSEEGAAGTVARGKAVIEAAPPFSAIYLTNADHAAGEIEHGGSAKAPRGVLALAAQRLRSRLARRQ